MPSDGGLLGDFMASGDRLLGADVGCARSAYGCRRTVAGVSWVRHADVPAVVVGRMPDHAYESGDDLGTSG